MTNRKTNRYVLNNLYAIAHTGMQSISDLLPEMLDGALKKELLKQYDGYKKNINDISEFMKENEMTPKDLNFFTKAMIKLSVKYKTMQSTNTSDIAEMTIKGTIKSCNNIKKDLFEKSAYTSKEVNALGKNLLHLLESYEENLKSYL